MFNPKARWDRDLPGEPREDLDEPIWVSAVFKRGKILPRYFIWGNRLYKVKDVTYYWQEKQGEELLHCFSVDTGVDLYQISFGNKNLAWKLNRVIAVGHNL